MRGIGVKLVSKLTLLAELLGPLAELLGPLAELLGPLVELEAVAGRVMVA